MNTTAFLLQSGTGITLKCDGIITNCESLVYYKFATALLLQNATWFIKNCDRYYKVRWIYLRLRQVVSKAHDNYKLRQYPGLVPSPHWWNLGNARNGVWEGVFLLSFPWCNVNSLKPSHQSSRKQDKRLGTSLRQFKVLPSTHPPTFLKAGAILLVRVPATIITSAWRWKKQKKIVSI